MPCSYITTQPALGDGMVVLLNRWIQAVGGSFGCGAQSEWFSLAQLVTLYGGVPRPGDTVAGLWIKLRRAIAGDDCFCGDGAFESARRILEALGGTFSPGDSIYNIVWEILSAVNGGAAPIPVPPVPVPPIEDCCLLLESSGSLLLETLDGCLQLESCP